MTDDFHLFSTDGGSAVTDADLALITAFLADELSAVQIAAVTDRLATDHAFRARVQPIIDAWAFPGSWDPAAAQLAQRRFERETSLTPAEIDAGWQRHVLGATQPTGAHARGRTRAARWRGSVVATGTRLAPPTSRLMRAAGIALVIGLPALGMAQVLNWRAEHPGATFGDAVSALLGFGGATRQTRSSDIVQLPARAASHSLGFDSAPVPATARPVPQIPPVSGAASAPPQGVIAQPAAAQGVPIRPLGRIVARATIPFGGVQSVHHLSDGRVLVNDALGRRLVLLDPNLANPIVVLDSLPGRPNSYGRTQSLSISYLGDTTLFFNPATRMLLVIDPAGRIARSTPMPGARPSFGSGVLSPHAFSATSTTLGVVMVGIPPLDLRGLKPGDTFVANDSIDLITFNMVTPRVDTLMRIGTGEALTMRLVAGRNRAEPVAPNARYYLSWLFSVHDYWAVTTDGSVAILRGQDYRLDWINPDRTMTASPRMPNDRKKNSEWDKVRIADSISRGFKATNGYALRAWQRDSAAGTARPRPIPLERVDASQVPDYLPAVAPVFSAMRADGDNNVWIQPRGYDPPLVYPHTVYDVVNRQGVLFDRVGLPTGKTLIGFGAGGWVYLVTHEAGTDVLERARVR